MKKNKLWISLAMIIALLLTCAIPAFAMESETAELPVSTTPVSPANLLNPLSNYDTLYYFSDNPNCQNTKTSLQTTITNIVLNDWSSSTIGFQEELAQYYLLGNWGSIFDSYIIFEVFKPLTREIEYSDEDLNLDDDECFSPDILEEMFQTFKENGCQIMFICNTDEMRFLDYNAFLDYVDIHINTDLLTTFISNVFYRAILDCNHDMQLSNCTFILDSFFSYNINTINGYQDNDFFREYFIPYFRSVYENEIRYGGQSLQQVMDVNNIKVVCLLSDGTYYDAVHRTSISFGSNFYSTYISNSHVYAIGSATFYDPITADSLEDLFDFRTTLNSNFPIYIYNPQGFIIENVVPNTFDSGSCTGYYSIIVDFLTDEDLNPYDNWSGRCIITHKAIEFDPDGWMVDVYAVCNEGTGSSADIDFYIPGWQIFMTWDDYCYYG